MAKSINQEKKDHYRFFSHKKCEYFPCHNTENPDNFNCLFCFCPLYMLGDQCGGKYKFTKEGYKDCSGCMIPHQKKGYDYILSKYKNILEKMRVIEK